MNTYHNERLKPFSQKMRREMAKEERHLRYDFLKALPVTVHRQKILGKYIADFYIASKKTVIEPEGSQHDPDAGVRSDRDRDAWMQKNGIRSCGIRTYRYSVNSIRFAAISRGI